MYFIWGELQYGPLPTWNPHYGLGGYIFGHGAKLSYNPRSRIHTCRMLDLAGKVLNRGNWGKLCNLLKIFRAIWSLSKISYALRSRKAKAQIKNWQKRLIIKENLWSSWSNFWGEEGGGLSKFSVWGLRGQNTKEILSCCFEASLWMPAF